MHQHSFKDPKAKTNKQTTTKRQQTQITKQHGHRREKSRVHYSRIAYRHNRLIIYDVKLVPIQVTACHHISHRPLPFCREDQTALQMGVSLVALYGPGFSYVSRMVAFGQHAKDAAIHGTHALRKYQNQDKISLKLVKIEKNKIHRYIYIYMCARACLCVCVCVCIKHANEQIFQIYTRTAA